MMAAPLPFADEAYDLRDGVTVTGVRPGEAETLGELFAGIDPWRSYPYPAELLTRFFASVEPGAPRFAIRLDGVLAGAVAVRVDWFRGPYIQTFALAPAVQGRGVGSAVIAWIESEARAAGQRNLWVAASDFNTGAHRFYARHGFERVADIDALVRDDRTEILMRKRLYIAS